MSYLIKYELVEGGYCTFGDMFILTIMKTALFGLFKWEVKTSYIIKYGEYDYKKTLENWDELIKTKKKL